MVVYTGQKPTQAKIKQQQQQQLQHFVPKRMDLTVNVINQKQKCRLTLNKSSLIICLTMSSEITAITATVGYVFTNPQSIVCGYSS